MTRPPTHQAIVTGTPGARITELDESVPPPLSAPVDAHRRLRGPYTGAGTLLRAVVPDALARVPDLVRAHDIEILTAAPELATLVEATRETLTSLAIPAEHTRFYSRLRTLRLAHGITEFLRDYARAVGGMLTLVLDRLDEADPTDHELAAVLVRRLDPAELTVVLGFGAAPDPASALGRAITRHARTVYSAAAATVASVAEPADLAFRYVESECTEADPRMRDAYLALPAAERAALHDARADGLVVRGETSLTLGAIPYHREHGSDPSEATAALRTALSHCVDLGFYEAAVDLGQRGRAGLDWGADPDSWWALTTRMTAALAALGRPVEAEELFDEARALSDVPSVHMLAAYSTAMLYTRHHDDTRKDHRKAMAWINEATALASMMSDPQERAFNTVFNRNGRALIETHLGHLDEALLLVGDGLARLEDELDADRHRLHRTVLRSNRAQVYAALGRLDDAVADFRAVIAQDPNYAEYHFDLGNLLRRLGRDREAMAEYETAMRLSPPFPELSYNRGDTRAALGDPAGAIADFRYVLELDPDYVDAHVNLAGLLADQGDPAAATAAVAAGLAVAPDNPYLHCVAARLALEAGDPVAASRAVELALTADPVPAQAWALRGALAYQDHDLTAAEAALAKAAALDPDPAVLFNLGAVHEELEQWEQALAAFTAALELDPQDPDARLCRSRCLARIGRTEAAEHDLRRYATRSPDAVT